MVGPSRRVPAIYWLLHSNWDGLIGRLFTHVATDNQHTRSPPLPHTHIQIVGGTLMMRDRAGDVAITSATGRIQPDRRWFGNTRVISQDDLDRYEDDRRKSVYWVGCMCVYVCVCRWGTHPRCTRAV